MHVTKSRNEAYLSTCGNARAERGLALLPASSGVIIARVACFAAAALLLSALPIAAAVDAWQWILGPYGQTSYFGTDPRASDDRDSFDDLLGYRSYINMGVYHEQGKDGWTGQTGMYSKDIRTPLPTTPGSSKTWRLYYWNTPGVPEHWIHTDLTYHFASDGTGNPLESIHFTLTLVGLPVGITHWNPPSSTSPQLGVPISLNEQTQWTTLLWTYKTDNGLDGYAFDMTATVVPEPSALLALSSGLAGMAGALRRRLR